MQVDDGTLALRPATAMESHGADVVLAVQESVADACTRAVKCCDKGMKLLGKTCDPSKEIGARDDLRRCNNFTGQM